MDDRRDRGPAGSRDVKHVGWRGRRDGGARHPVQRLVDASGLYEIDGRRHAGLWDPLGEHRPKAHQKRGPPLARAEDPPDAGGVLARPGQSGDDLLRISMPAQNAPDQDRGQLDAITASSAPAPLWQRL